VQERLGIAGSGAIATGLAAVAVEHGEVALWARSESSAERADKRVAKLADDADHGVEVHTDLSQLTGATFVVEAIVEDADAKAAHLAELDGLLDDEAIIATTTSSLSIEALAKASGRPDRFAGFHVFNPVTRMKLVELAFPAEATDDTRARAHALCEALEKVPVEVPDVPGFVVNRLLFPYLFGAVRLLEETGMPAEDVDTCMTLGAGHPLGPLALLDLVGLDVSIAIGETLGEDIPARLRALAEEGALGRKAGRGFHSY
jgi:3-hydroxybutyryl-CoA dehydrogenase